MRHHVLESGLQKAVKAAVRKAGIAKRVGCHTMRHSCATHLLENGINIRMVQELMGHNDVKTTEIYTHVMNKGLVYPENQAVFPISPSKRAGFRSVLPGRIMVLLSIVLHARPPGWRDTHCAAGVSPAALEQRHWETERLLFRFPQLGPEGEQFFVAPVGF